METGDRVLAESLIAPYRVLIRVLVRLLRFWFPLHGSFPLAAAVDWSVDETGQVYGRHAKDSAFRWSGHHESPVPDTDSAEASGSKRPAPGTPRCYREARSG